MGSSLLAAKPQAATQPPCAIERSSVPSMFPPTVSMPPAQRAVSNGRPLVSSASSRPSILVAPRLFKYSWLDNFPVTAATS